jgi:hypothetical protein
MHGGLFLVDLPKDRGPVIDRLIPPSPQTCRDAADLAAKDNSVPGRTPTATFMSSDAARPRVPVQK